MQTTVIHGMEIVVGGLLMALGLLYIQAQVDALNQLEGMVNEAIIDDENLDQQYSNIDLGLITEKELFAVVMGYREFPIVIEEVTIRTDGNDYDYYLSLIKAGIYQKQYEYDADHKVTQINYIFCNGST